MKARIKWIENVCFVGESGSGHAIVMDGAPEGGGTAGTRFRLHGVVPLTAGRDEAQDMEIRVRGRQGPSARVGSPT